MPEFVTSDTQNIRCSACDIDRVVVHRFKRSVQADLFAAAILFAGLWSVVYRNPKVGVAMMALSFILSGLNKELYAQLTCPKCGSKGRIL
jgi:hypothetical protein